MEKAPLSALVEKGAVILNVKFGPKKAKEK